MSANFEHQDKGIAFLQEHKKVVLADEMGLGKTRQAILAAKDYSWKHLIVCPASLKINWSREIADLTDGEKVQILQGGKTATARKEYEKGNPDWVIVNYDILHKHLEWLKPLVDSGEMGTVVLDEAQYIKGKANIRTVATLSLCENARNVYALTGSPVMNRPIELYSLLQAVGHPLGRKGARTTFVTTYCGGQENRKPILRGPKASLPILPRQVQVQGHAIQRRKRSNTHP